MTADTALRAALMAYRRPAHVDAMREVRLPADMLEVIRIAAGDSDVLAAAADAMGGDEAVLQDAAQLFLQRLLADSRASDWRLLGLEPGATQAQIRDHKRWLLKWLHPDRNKNKWESALFNRVSQAADRLQAGTPASPTSGSPDRLRQHRRAKQNLWRHVRQRQKVVDTGALKKRLRLAACLIIALLGGGTAALAYLADGRSFGSLMAGML
jgi:hypothetical protein